MLREVLNVKSLVAGHLLHLNPLLTIPSSLASSILRLLL
jgi:hypothetical protein